MHVCMYVCMYFYEYLHVSEKDAAHALYVPFGCKVQSRLAVLFRYIHCRYLLTIENKKDTTTEWKCYVSLSLNKVVKMTTCMY